MRILQQVPSSVLWLYGSGKWKKTVRARLRAAATKHAVDSRRLRFLPRLTDRVQMFQRWVMTC
jgi:predicted O-linked N-acetylglucosamine transferase (SPINDLY family)